MFIEYNANPFKANIGDCMIRSISLALDMNYMDVFDGLIKIVDERGWELVKEYRMAFKSGNIWYRRGDK